MFEIQNLSNELKINVGSTMEEMEDYLDKEGWKPEIDTLAKFAQWNEWVRQKNFTLSKKSYDSISVFILRELSIKNNLLDQIKELIKKEGFKIVIETHLKDDVRSNAIKHLRGGTWKDQLYKDNTNNFEPAYALVILDNHKTNLNRFSSLKEKIRKKFDRNISPSIVHSADNEVESWNYINYCFPRSEKEIENSIKNLKKIKISKPSYLQFIKFFPYYKALLNSKIKSTMMKIINK